MDCVSSEQIQYGPEYKTCSLISLILQKGCNFYANVPVTSMTSGALWYMMAAYPITNLLLLKKMHEN